MWKYIFLFMVIATSAYAEKKVLAFAGSTRTDSVNKKLLNEAASIARAYGADVTVIDLRDYPTPFYDGDLEVTQGMPENAKAFRQLLKEHDVVLIASPQYNASVSAVLKNTIDWASRNEQGVGSKDAFKGKTYAIMAASPSLKGGVRGLIHLRTILEDVGGKVITKEVTVPDAYNAFDTQGLLKDSQKKAELEALVLEAIK